MRDELTGLPNRSSILEFARLQFNLYSHTGLDLCVALLDLDRFKSINDSHGQAAGDAAQQAFAEACRQELRATDVLGRYGGDEFLLVMPGVDAGQVPRLFARLREAVQAMPARPGATRLAFSLGAAQAAEAETLVELLGRMDGALYQAKQDGRDRYVVAPAPHR